MGTRLGSSEELITEFCRECWIVRKGLAGDLKKAMKDGKPIIIEGIHLDPSIYLMDDKNKSPSASPAIGKEKGSEKSKNGIPAQKNHSDPCGRQPEKNSCPQVGSAGKTESAMDMVSDSLKSVDISGNTPNDEGGTVKASDAIEDLLNKKDKAGTESSDEE
ncbi:uncharacterized protein [Primulina eburnea]